VTLLAQPADEFILELVTGMVGGEGDAHGAYLACNFRPRHRRRACE
jgi:hypothetical protein